MSWFGKKSSEAFSLPFPKERLFALAMLIPAEVARAVRMRSGPLVTTEDVLNSLFFNTYICAYPAMLDDRDPREGAAVRLFLLSVIFEPDEANRRLRFDVFKMQLESGNPQVQEIAALARDDGTRYFSALIDGIAADDQATLNLNLLIRARERFDPIRL